MTEQKNPIDDDGLDMNQQTFHGADNYSPLSNYLCEEYGLNVSAVFGKIWALSRKETYSYASNGMIAKQLGIDPHTVGKAIRILLELRLIADVTEKYKDEHIEKFGKYKKTLPFHKQVKFYQPYAKVLASLKKNKQKTL